MGCPEPKDYSKPEYPPLLAGGFHQMTIEEVRGLCVTGFAPNEARRAEIMSGLETVLARLAPLGLDGELWIDGSFLTQDLGPGDVDFILRIKGTVYDAAQGEMLETLNWFDQENLKTDYCCDCTLALVYDDGDPLYDGNVYSDHMANIFGKSLAGTPKGIAVVTIGNGLP